MEVMEVITEERLAAVTQAEDEERQELVSDARRARRATALRDQVMRAALIACGEIGYGRLSVQVLLDRTPTSRSGFYSYFEDLNHCLTEAYEDAIERLADQMLRSATHMPDWRSGLRAALVQLLMFVEDEPEVAKALLFEAYAIGGRALQKRDEVMKRFALAMDRARADASSDHWSPPPMAAMGIVGGIESLLQAHLATGDPPIVWEAFPAMMYLAVAEYFGIETAGAELGGECAS